MSAKKAQIPLGDANQAPRGERPLSPEEVKTRMKEQGLTLKRWAADRGYPYDTVSCVLRGVNRATYGIGHRIAVELGLK